LQEFNAIVKNWADEQKAVIYTRLREVNAEIKIPVKKMKAAMKAVAAGMSFGIIYFVGFPRPNTVLLFGVLRIVAAALTAAGCVAAYFKSQIGEQQEERKALIARKEEIDTTCIALKRIRETGIDRIVRVHKTFGGIWQHAGGTPTPPL